MVPHPLAVGFSRFATENSVKAPDFYLDKIKLIY